MRRLLMAPLAAAALLLGACETLTSVAASAAGAPPSPQAAADRIVLDEQLLGGAELAYKGARIAVEIMVDAGQCAGACATRFRDLNRRAFAALGAARTAYRAVNAESYFAAIAEVHGLAAQILALTGRSG